MSWWVYMQDIEERETLLAPDGHEEGGTHVLGGTNRCELNMTYNYGGLLRAYGVHPSDDLAHLDGISTLKSLRRAHDNLADIAHDQPPCEDYWHPCPANVAKAVALLHSWADYHPTGIWVVH